MTDDLVKQLRDMARVDGCRVSIAAADRIDTLTAQLESTLKDRAQIIAERDQWIQHAKNAVWADSEELKALTADNARLREALQQFLIEYDEVDLASAEPSSLTAAVFSARATLTTGKADT